MNISTVCLLAVLAVFVSLFGSAALQAYTHKDEAYHDCVQLQWEKANDNLAYFRILKRRYCHHVEIGDQK